MFQFVSDYIFVPVGGGPNYGGGGGSYPRGGASMRGATGPPRMYAMRGGGSPPKALGGGGGVWGSNRLPPGVGSVTTVGSRQQPMYGGGTRGFQGRGAGWVLDLYC